jgi:hypothetical protein
LGHVIRHTNREKGSLVIIDGEARSVTPLVLRARLAPRLRLKRN